MNAYGKVKNLDTWRKDWHIGRNEWNIRVLINLRFLFKDPNVRICDHIEAQSSELSDISLDETCFR